MESPLPSVEDDVSAQTPPFKHVQVDGVLVVETRVDVRVIVFVEVVNKVVETWVDDVLRSSQRSPVQP
jgi:hypothetical protein